MSDIRLNNPHKKNPEDVRSCPKCGAPLLSEVCQFCGTYIGEVATADLTPEYPLVECKNARLGFWNVGFPLIFGGIFLCVSLPMFLISLFVDSAFEGSGNMGKSMTLFTIPFMLIGFVAIGIALRTVFRHLQVKKHGVERSGVVYGYMDDTVAYNGVNGQKVKILVDTSEGKKFILLPLGSTSKQYEVNSTVELKLKDNWALILTKKVNW
ncbi:MAG: hypothetical protein IKH92_01885 [Clostridiales bacterium]|nr:hypothetical protein [Clostridiales bacterium]